MAIEKDNIKIKQQDWGLLKRFFSFVLNYKGKFISSIILLLVGALLSVLGPLIIKKAIDGPINNEDINGLATFALIFLVIQILRELVGFTEAYIRNFMGQCIVRDLRFKLFNHIIRLPQSFYDKNPVGRLVTRLTNDVENLSEVFISGMALVISDILMIVFICAMMLYINFQLALIVISALPIMIIISIIFRIKIRTVYDSMRVKVAALNSFLQESIGGINLIHILSTENRQEFKFKKINEDFLKYSLKSVFYFTMFFPSIGLLISLSIGAMVWYGVGIKIVTFGTLMAFLQLTQRFFHPMRDLAQKYDLLQRGMAASERIFSLMDMEIEKTVDFGEYKNNQKTPNTNIQGEIEFENVWLAYDNDNYVIKDVSFNVKQGESVAIVGLTGAGKTSIINILCKFYDYQKGSVFLDGKDLKSIETTELRNSIGLILQDVFLLSRSVYDNVRLGTDASDEKVRNVCEKLGVNSFVERLKHSYETQINERGAGLSAGEKQLISFARAMASNPKILILDEATSNIDSQTENILQSALQKLIQDRTSIIIAHRLSTIKNVDKIIVLHKGKLVEQGTHEDLIKKKGIYFKLYNLQEGVKS